MTLISIDASILYLELQGVLAWHFQELLVHLSFSSLSHDFITYSVGTRHLLILVPYIVLLCYIAMPH